NSEGAVTRTNQVAMSLPAPEIALASQSGFSLSGIQADPSAGLKGDITSNLSFTDKHLDTFRPDKVPAFYNIMVIEAHLNGVSINDKLSSSSSLFVQWEAQEQRRHHLGSPFPQLGSTGADGLQYSNVPLSMGTNILSYEVKGALGFSGSLTGT